MHPTLSRSTRLRHVASAAIFLVVLAGCGRSIPSQPAAALPPPATGTGTLFVQAEISGSSSESGGYATEYTAIVQDALGAPVTGATVRLRTPDGQVLLTEAPGVTGTYSYTGVSYGPGIYSLDVISGSDRVTGAWVVAPGTHSVVSPAAHDTVTANSNLVVDWDGSDSTEEVTVETLDYQTSISEDPGSAVIPGANNPPRDNQRITVVRKNHATITGARPGSEIMACYVTTVEPVIAR